MPSQPLPEQQGIQPQGPNDVPGTVQVIPTVDPNFAHPVAEPEPTGPQFIIATGENVRSPLSKEQTLSLGTGAIDAVQGRKPRMFDRFKFWAWGKQKNNADTSVVPASVDSRVANETAEDIRQAIEIKPAFETLSLDELMAQLPEAIRKALEDKRRREHDGVEASTERTAKHFILGLTEGNIEIQDIDDPWEVNKEYDDIDYEVQNDIEAAEEVTRSEGLQARREQQIRDGARQLEVLLAAAQMADATAEAKRQELAAHFVDGINYPLGVTRARQAYNNALNAQRALTEQIGK